MKEPKSLLKGIVEYYAERADVYDETAGYTNAEAEKLRNPIKERYRRLFAGHDVLEIACGTGYWTQVIGEVAKSLLATDINQSVINLACRRCSDLHNVEFCLADAFSLRGIPNHFTAAVAIWWWSHIPKNAIGTFLNALHSKLVPGAVVLFSDHLSSVFASYRVDADGNNIELRTLPDGRSFEVVKNYPSEREITDALGDSVDNIKYTERPVENSWMLTYTTGR